ncbi:hypothetical protein, partial [Streptacidiphilus sp. EB129]|uniref:hypothetical protein n=1 Tax=Streptacidiphilus sp. EB129 TaxID=3156262 RepID=UPI003512CF89
MDDDGEQTATVPQEPLRPVLTRWLASAGDRHPVRGWQLREDTDPVAAFALNALEDLLAAAEPGDPQGWHKKQTDTGWGVRLALSAVKGACDDEVQRLAAGQPYAGLQDLWQRARPSLPLA